MKIISMLNFKGGVGKTTTTILLNEYIKTIHNKKVCVIDFDNQLNISLLKNKKIDYSFIDYLQGKKESFNYFINNDFVSGSNGINNLNIDVNIFKNFFKKLSKYYDYLLIDLSPFENQFNINILSLSDVIICPNNSDLFSLNSITKVYKYFNYFNNNNNNKMICIFNNIYTNSKLEKELIKDFLNKYKNDLKDIYFINDVIKKSVKIKENIIFNKNIFLCSNKNKLKNELLLIFNEVYNIINK